MLMSPIRARINRPPDARVQQRTYHFAATNEDLPYAIYLSSKVSKDKKSPLIVALHGLGSNPNSLLRDNAIDLAEAGGYILVGPMGYNPRGWYGSPLLKPPPGATRRPPNPEAANDPANLRDLSEKDVMNVRKRDKNASALASLALIRSDQSNGARSMFESPGLWGRTKSRNCG